MRALTLFLLPLLVSCAFHTKEFVSELEIEGQLYRNNWGEGRYISRSPDIALHLACYKATTLGTSGSFLVPMPVSEVRLPHESISDQEFSFTLGLSAQTLFAPEQLTATIETEGKTSKLWYVKTTSQSPEYSKYQYRSKLKCGEILNATLTINIGDKNYRYKLEFKEKLQRDFSFHLVPTT